MTDIPAEVMFEWRCIDHLLCRFEMEFAGRIFTAHRTYMDTVSIWLGKEKIGTANNLIEAREIVLAKKWEDRDD